MAAKRSEKSPFRSAYGGGWIAAGQALAELMCERVAQKNGVVLKEKFWTEPAWAKAFKVQLTFANALLKKYSAEAIFRAVRTSTVYSLNVSWLEALVVAQEKVVEQHRQARPVVSEPQQELDLPTGPRPVFAIKKSILCRLREFDGEKECR